MRIAINALSMGDTGARIYLTNLVQSLAKIDSDNQYIVIATESGRDGFRNLPNNFEVCVPSSMRSSWMRVVWEQTGLLAWLLRKNIDVLFSPWIDCLSARFVSVPSVLAIQSVLTVQRNWTSYCTGSANSYKTIRGWILFLLAHLSMLTSCRIVVPSQTTVSLLRSEEKIRKIRVVPYGVDDRLFKPRNRKVALEWVNQQYGIGGEYLLAVSSFFPYKGYSNLIRAFRILADQTEIDCELVIVGSPAEPDHYQEVIDLISDTSLESKVKLLGHVPHDSLPLLYSGCSVYVFPSLCEVFGLTQLEAMACGAPVATSNTSAMPEVCGDAAIYFDPYLPESIAEALRALFVNENLRDDLSAKGIARARKFSWTNTAREMLEIFSEVNAQI